MRFRKRPVVEIVDAMQFDGSHEGARAVIRWADSEFVEHHHATLPPHNVLVLFGVHEVAKAHAGDWIIKSRTDGFLRCKDHVFKTTYEPLKEEPSGD